MTTELLKVPFEGDTLEAIPQGNHIWVSVRRICEALGIDNMTQQAKLKKKPWATVGQILAVAQDGRIRDVFCLHLDSVPMWLAGIEARRVNRDIRPKLERYQLKCAKVLKEAFLKPSTPPSSSQDPLDLIIHQAQGLVAVATEMKNQSQRITVVESEVKKLVDTRQEAEKALLHVERATEKPREKTTRSKINELVRAYCFSRHLDHPTVWNKLYRELNYRYHFDAKSRAKHQSCPVLEIVEEEGLLDALFRIASDVLILPNSGAIESSTQVESSPHGMEAS